MLLAGRIYVAWSDLYTWLFAETKKKTRREIQKPRISARRQGTPESSNLEKRRNFHEAGQHLEQPTRSASRLWTMWLALCFAISSPGTLFAMLQTIPGFLGNFPGLVRLITWSVSLCTSFLTAVCLPSIARAVERKHPVLSRQDLLSMAHVVTLPLLPSLSNFVFHTQCLGQWTRLWQPCTQHPSPIDAMEHVRLPFFQGSFRYFETSDASVLNEALLRRPDLCGRGHMSVGTCVSAIVDKCAPILLSTAVDLTFTGAIWRLLLRRPLRVREATIHAVRAWTLVVIVGH